MKREILFRGKNNSSGNWIYGLPTYDFQNIFDGESLNSTDNYDINPETIGQFTGLTDKNGDKIFEGDILEYHKHPGYLMESCSMLVCFNTEKACFAYQSTNSDHPDWMYPFSEHHELEHDILSHCEIIGNIHDNPELLK